VRLVEVDATNWRDLIRVAPHPHQDSFVAPIAYYLCLSHYGGEWHPLAIEADGTVVGHVMWAIDDADSSVWLGGLVIDAGAQRRGIGHTAVAAFLQRFATGGHTNVALSYSPDNLVARKLYADLGFVETGETEGEEVVARHVT
jgi:diamine N-acetyltransferase